MLCDHSMTGVLACGHHVLCFFRKMGKVLFLDEDRMHVPLIVGSLTDEGFVSSDNCYLRNSQMGELGHIPHCSCAFQCQVMPHSHFRRLFSGRDCRFLIHFINTQQTLCATSSLLQTCHQFSHHIVCMICPPLAKLAQRLCTQAGIQVSLVSRPSLQEKDG